MVDLAANSLVRPVLQWPVRVEQQQQAPARPQPPFFALQPNKLYAVQCLVEHSRPRSQVSWFNRTAPVELVEAVDKQRVEQLHSDAATLSASALLQRYGQLEGQNSSRQKSFTRYLEHLHDGTFR